MDSLQGLVALAVAYWRLLRLYERAIMEWPPNRHAKGVAHLRYASNRLMSIMDENGLRLIAYEGQNYTPSLPVSVLNGDEFEDNQGLVVDQTLEPTVIRNGHVIAIGKVVLRKEV